MPDYEIVEHCAPTLAGMKIGNLFAVYGSYDSVCREIRALNRRLGRFGIRVIPFRRQKDRTLIYLFRPEGLKQYFDHPETKRFLLQKGYPASQPERCVALLAERMRTDEGFPHEVGLFLGYPAKDVEGFIADSRKGASSCGCVCAAWSKASERLLAYIRFGYGFVSARVILYLYFCPVPSLFR